MKASHNADNKGHLFSDKSEQVILVFTICSCYQDSFVNGDKHMTRSQLFTATNVILNKLCKETVKTRAIPSFSDFRNIILNTRDKRSSGIASGNAYSLHCRAIMGKVSPAYIIENHWIFNLKSHFNHC